MTLIDSTTEAQVRELIEERDRLRAALATSERFLNTERDALRAAVERLRASEATNLDKWREAHRIVDQYARTRMVLQRLYTKLNATIACGRKGCLATRDGVLLCIDDKWTLDVDAHWTCPKHAIAAAIGKPTP